MNLLEKADNELVRALHPSPNFGERLPPPKSSVPDDSAQHCGPTMLIMHYTGMHSCAGAIDWLSRPESGVSCHYVVDVDGAITQLVAEKYRAWHAGAGSWADDNDINSASIGIEVHNLGHELGYPDFPEQQMKAVEALSRDIVVRQQIPSHRVLGHSDVAPLRKGDPGEKFDWQRLARAGVGYWREPAPVDARDHGIGLDDYSEAASGEGASGETPPEHQMRIIEMRDLLKRFGYGLDPVGGFDLALQKTILAFQRHFRPARCDGRLDRSTLASLQRLVAGLDALQPSARRASE